MRFLLAFSFLAIVTIASAQSKTRLPVWTYNTQNTKVYGLAAGYFTTDRIDSVTTNGVRFELLGLGILLGLIPDVPISKDEAGHQEYLQTHPAETINGFNISPLGHGCDCNVNGFNIYGVGSITKKVNGISASLMMNIAEVHNGLQAAYYFNFTYKMNGIQVAGISNKNYGMLKGIQIAAAWNEANELHGVQIGLYNKASRMRGVQIGAWNDNGRRKRPLLNW